MLSKRPTQYQCSVPWSVRIHGQSCYALAVSCHYQLILTSQPTSKHHNRHPSITAGPGATRGFRETGSAFPVPRRHSVAEMECLFRPDRSIGLNIATSAALLMPAICTAAEPRPSAPTGQLPTGRP